MNTLIHGQELPALLKYPRTPHLEGSRLQNGDQGHEQVPYAQLAGRHIVIEEKLDGGNSGVSFNHGGEQLLRSRGHYLAGGGRERQFNLFKRWASAHEGALLDKLEDRYVLYGEWLHKKHSVFYDALPHYFAEFDIWDRSTEAFLSTPARSALLAGAPVLAVPVLYQGIAPRTLREFRGTAQRRSPWQGRQAGLATTIAGQVSCLAHALRAGDRRRRSRPAKAWQQCDKSDLTEGLYIKVEENGRTIERYKWVRADFVQAILESARHHAEQPFVPNQLRQGVDIYAPVLTHTWQENTA